MIIAVFLVVFCRIESVNDTCKLLITVLHIQSVFHNCSSHYCSAKGIRTSWCKLIGLCKGINMKPILNVDHRLVLLELLVKMLKYKLILLESLSNYKNIIICYLFHSQKF